MQKNYLKIIIQTDTKLLLNKNNNSNLFSQSTIYNSFRLKNTLFRLKNSFRYFNQNQRN